ncbi:alpha/beta hydrolase [Nonomuraea sp. SBT364]|uniref:alpha/beta hydrolase n=1 Tax=Nonomuraea sp. SBT364 TaxID=1580530 RepID=UPI00066EBD7A|nr:alpha/beta hydrolase [Nonomuraea sp. SBT364]
MATYVLIHAAAVDSWCWHLLEAELRARGHDVVAVDLPSDDDSAGLAEYADTVVDAVGDRGDVVVVAHSFGGFTAPLVCERLAADLLVMLQAQIPLPGETPGDWWGSTGYAEARSEADERNGLSPEAADDPMVVVLHDTPHAIATEFLTKQRDQSGTPFALPWPLKAWPDVPTKVLLARDDRFFPLEFMRRVTRDRLGVEPDVMPGDHCPMLGRANEVADRLEEYRLDCAGAGRCSAVRRGR